MGLRWGGLKLGDVVCKVARTRRMIVTDLDLDDPTTIICAWKGNRGRVIERAFHRSTLVLVRPATQR